jgi:HAD superfamily hydrolase (TIGR01509 family)
VSAIAAVIFDLDGVLLDSEQIWDKAREEYVGEKGGAWHPEAQRDMMGMSSSEWSRYMHDRLGVPFPAERISADVVGLIVAIYDREGLPIISGAPQAVERLAALWPLGLASSSNRPVIDYVMRAAPFGKFFRVTVSSEEVARGKPAPDVYLKTASALGAEPARCAGIEDSHNGILALRNAGMRTIAIPNHRYPPGKDALAAADAVLDSIAKLTPEIVKGNA